MIDVKTGTQTWSNSAPKAPLKSDGANNLSATDREKYFQNGDVGETLNKITDPNYVDNSKKMRTVGSNQLDKDAFMSLLLTQMKNQDPTNPLKSHEMAAQLAQFTQLEKLTNIDQGLAGLRKDSVPGHNFQALSLIGKSLKIDNSKVQRTDATQSHDIRFSLTQAAQNVDIAIKDANGTVIRQLTVPNLKSGKNEIQWNGQFEDGSAAPVGEYSIDIQAKASNGAKIIAETKVEGLITGINFTPKGPQLMVGRNVVNLSDVKSITDPNVAQESAAPSLGGKAVDISELSQGSSPNAPAKVKPEAKDPAQEAKKAKLSQGDISEAAMTQDFINALNKQGTKAGGMTGKGSGEGGNG